MSVISPLFLPVYKPLAFIPGLPFSYPFTYYQGIPTSGVTVDLTNAFATMRIFLNATVLLNVNSGTVYPATGIYFGGQENNPLDGIINIVIDSADTGAASWKYANYELTLSTNVFGQQLLMHGTISPLSYLPS